MQREIISEFLRQSEREREEKSRERGRREKEKRELANPSQFLIN